MNLNNKMLKKITIFIFFFLFSFQIALAKEDNSLILYYGQGCPHCAEVENFIIPHSLDSKLAIRCD